MQTWTPSARCCGVPVSAAAFSCPPVSRLFSHLFLPVSDWSADATSAPAVCFSSVNKQGNKYGNCGQLTNGSYLPCAAA